MIFLSKMYYNKRETVLFDNSFGHQCVYHKMLVKTKRLVTRYRNKLVNAVTGGEQNLYFTYCLGQQYVKDG